MKNNQEQKAGDNSLQVQTGVMIVNQGITEKRAREIYDEKFQSTRQEFSFESLEKIQQRISGFENDLILRMQKIEGTLNAFADPSFQAMLCSAHKTAAITDNEDDYAILSELLIHKIQNGNNRNKSIGIKQAIEIVNEIPETTLFALTVQYAWDVVEPVSGIISDGLDVLEKLFSTLIYDELPQDTEWIEQLDVLNAIRITDFGNFKKLEDYYFEKFNGYCCLGIKKDTEDYSNVCELLKSINISNLLIANELNKDYSRLAIVNKKQINNLKRVVVDGKTGNVIEVALLDNEKEILNKIFDMYDKTIDTKIKEEFIKKIEERPNLKKLRDWINKIPKSYITTPIGRVLAHANAQRISTEFPPLN